MRIANGGRQATHLKYDARQTTMCLQSQEMYDEYEKVTYSESTGLKGRDLPARNCPVYWDDGVDMSSDVTSQIKAAEILVQQGDYESAYDAFQAAAEIFCNDRESITASVDTFVSHLTTIGGRSMPPHPVALHLTRLRRKLTA